MEYYNNTLCVSHAELTDGIISAVNIRKLVERKRIDKIRRACYETPALYAVSSLPSKYQSLVRAKYEDPRAEKQSRGFVDKIVIDQAAANFFEGVTIEGSRGLKADQITKLTNNASILNAFKTMLDDAAAMQAKVGRRNRVKLTQFWKDSAAELEKVSDVYPHSLPGNPRSLQRKYNAYIRGGYPNYDTLISGKFGNKFSAKIATPEQAAAMIKLLNFHTKLDCQEAADYYNTLAKEHGWRPITARTAHNWMVTFGWVVDAGRKGAKAYMNERGMQVKRFRPTAPMLFWSLDGWTVELYFQRKVNGKARTYCNRLTAVVVLDPFNNYPIGYAIGDRECPALITAALRNATNHTAELFGQRLRPMQIQSDNYQIKKMMSTYKGMAEYVTPAEVGNAKAKPVEPYFRYLNKNYAKRCSGNWSGYGITARKESQPDMEWLDAHKTRIPEREEVERQIEWMMQSERQLKGPEYVAGWPNLPKEYLLPMDTKRYLMLFGEETGYKNSLEGSGLNIRLLGQKRTYDSFDLEFRKYAHLRWNIKYDPDNLEEVLAMSDEGDIRFLLKEKFVQPMALADRRPGDAEELQKVRDFNKALKREIIEFDQAATEIVQGSLLRHPDLDNPYVKSLITDSRGQNKDKKNDYRLEYGSKAEEAKYEEAAGAGAISTYDLY